MERPVKKYEEVSAMLAGASAAFEKLVGYIRFHYAMDEIWAEGKPTHKNRNNLYFKRGGKSFAILGLREGYFIACIVFGKDEREKFEECRDSFCAEVQTVYDNAEVLHDGKWLGFELYDERLVDDIIKLLAIKRKPNRKELPRDIGNCGRLDIGMAHAEITAHVMGDQ